MTTNWKRGPRARSPKAIHNPAVREKMDPEFLIYADLTRKFYMSKKIARYRDQGWSLTREQYIEFWLDEGRVHRRDRAGLVMARVNKNLAWSWDNIECVTRAQDLALRGAGFRGNERPRRAVWVGDKKFGGQREAAREFGVAPSHARYRCKVKMTTEDGLWRYDDEP